ncbi:methyltransferase domain-containing protein [Actinoplanes sp. CA-131856]
MPERIAEVTAFLAEVLAPRAPLTVIVDGGDHGAAATFAARLAAAFPPSARAWSVDAVLGLTGPSGSVQDSALNVLEPAADRVIVYLRSTRGTGATGPGERRAQIVIDHHDPRWPVIRHVHPRLADPSRWYLSESQAFFAPKAAGWDKRFGNDLPAYAAAVATADPSPGDLAVDVGCGTGRALPALAAAVGPTGRVIGLDCTTEMLTEARTHSHPAAPAFPARISLIKADALHLPLASAQAAVVFAAGLVHHLPDPAAGLAELSRVTRPGGRLVLFHPSGRKALAARHGRTLSPDEPMNEDVLTTLLTKTGWTLTRYEDPDDHFLALATRIA